jgi:hypothetical protein
LLGLAQRSHIVLIMFSASELGRVPELDIIAIEVVVGDMCVAAAFVDFHGGTNSQNAVLVSMDSTTKDSWKALCPTQGDRTLARRLQISKAVSCRNGLKQASTEKRG